MRIPLSFPTFSSPSLQLLIYIMRASNTCALSLTTKSSTYPSSKHAPINANSTGSMNSKTRFEQILTEYVTTTGKIWVGDRTLLHWRRHLVRMFDWGPPSLLLAGPGKKPFSFLFRLLSLLFLFFPQCNFHNCSQCMLAAIDPAKKSLSM